MSDYNRAVRSHNSRVRSNRVKLQQELARLRRGSSGGARGQITVSAQSVHSAFQAVENSHERGTFPQELLSIFEDETASSLRAANALEGRADAEQREIDAIRETTITTELWSFAPELDVRWKGALFSLTPENPDAARHFCTSARECIVQMLDVSAPDDVVERELTGCQKTDQGRVTRCSKLRYLLERRGLVDPAVENFVNEDVEDLLGLFRQFNDGTHGAAGRFASNELVAAKQRAERGIQFLCRIAAR